MPICMCTYLTVLWPDDLLATRTAHSMEQCNMLNVIQLSDAGTVWTDTTLGKSSKKNPGVSDFGRTGGGVSPNPNLYFDFSLEKTHYLETLVNHLLGVFKHFLKNWYFWIKIVSEMAVGGGGLGVSAKIRNLRVFFFEDFPYTLCFLYNVHNISISISYFPCMSRQS